MQKKEERNKQFLVEKKIHSIEFANPYKRSIEKKPEVTDTVESNYMVIRRVYQNLYSDIADIFYEYVYSLDPNEIKELDQDIKSNRWGVKMY